MKIIPVSSPSFSFSFAYASLEWLACKQALHFGAIVKSRRARGTRPSRFASLAQIGERVRTLENDEERRNENARLIVGRESEEQRLPPFFNWISSSLRSPRAHYFSIIFTRILRLNFSVRASAEEKRVHLTLCLLRTRDVHSGVG